MSSMTRFMTDLLWNGRTHCRDGQNGGLAWAEAVGATPPVGLYQDAFQPADIDEVHVQDPPAGGVQALGDVAPAQP